jgi:hypothetical protein
MATLKIVRRWFALSFNEPQPLLYNELLWRLLDGATARICPDILEPVKNATLFGVFSFYASTRASVTRDFMSRVKAVVYDFWKWVKYLYSHHIRSIPCFLKSQYFLFCSSKKWTFSRI